MKQFLAVTVPVGIIRGYRRYRPGWVTRRLSAGSSTRALKAVETGTMGAWRALFHYGLPNLGSVHDHGWGVANWGTKPDVPMTMGGIQDPHGLWADAPDKPWN